MELLLWRHAEAVDATPGQLDIERPLTKRGKSQARRVAAWLNEYRPKHLRILVSPAKRCQQTAQALALSYEVEPTLGLGADLREVLNVAGWPEESARWDGSDKAVLLVGHQPTLGQLAAFLMCGEEHDWNVKKGALWWFSGQDGNGWPETLLRAVIAPDMVK